jgi:shikimate dehydrogenase
VIKACVIGHPLSHSLSPLIHNHWFQTYGIEGIYKAMPVPPEQLLPTIEILRQNYNGFNVTLPFKRTLIPLCQTLGSTAQIIAAVNTVTVGQDGSFHGRNTDTYGFAQNLQQKFPNFDWRKGSALILGAGGAARAIAYALKEKGVAKIYISNRTSSHAAALSAQFSLENLKWDSRENFPADLNLLINTTSLGMKGQPPLDLDLSSLPSSTTVYDIVYAPLITPMLQAAQTRGNPIVTGIGMLLHQAVPAFEVWTGVRPEVTPELETILLQAMP